MRKVNEQSPHINLDTFQNTNTVKVNGNRLTYKLDYCYVSQKGFYPTDTSKANQDSYLVCENILGNTSCHLFGVFDGHGEFGDLCSHFSANEVSNHQLITTITSNMFYSNVYLCMSFQFDGILEKQIKNHGGLVSFNNDDKLESFYTKAFVETNNMLHKSKIDDSLSGTTAITVVVHEDHLYVANVGDSRAIIASQADDGKLKYSPLSHDQTPFRRDERERVKKLVIY
jgi:serine/threonine protein phosphatase PrpC